MKDRRDLKVNQDHRELPDRKVLVVACGSLALPTHLGMMANVQAQDMYLNTTTAAIFQYRWHNLEDRIQWHGNQRVTSKDQPDRKV